MFKSLDRCLLQHRALNRDNPILRGLLYGSVNVEQLTSILIQYTFLVRWIVSFLSIGAVRFSNQPAVKKELERNIGEECGSRTNGTSHQQILYDRLKQELGIDVRTVLQSPATQVFLLSIQNALIHQTLCFAGGMIYALEASAVPELLIVAELLTHAGAKINLETLTKSERAKQAQRKTASEYTLEDFLSLHVVDFEEGHRNGLRLAFRQDGISDEQQFEQGFEYLLNLMDQWWEELSREK